MRPMNVAFLPKRSCSRSAQEHPWTLHAHQSEGKVMVSVASLRRLISNSTSRDGGGDGRMCWPIALV